MNNEAPKVGMVAVYFTHGMGNIFEKLSRESLLGTGFLGQALPLKYSGVHYCFPSSKDPLTFGIQSTLMMSLGKYARIRARSHCGSRLECAYALKSFGIDIDSLGRVDATTLSKSTLEMIDLCKRMDKQKTENDKRLLPRPNDVLLGRGRPFQLFPGNLALTNLINANKERYDVSRKMEKKKITEEIVNLIKNCNGRFLKRSNEKASSYLMTTEWEEVKFETARLKVSHSFRTMTKSRTNEEMEGSTSRNQSNIEGHDGNMILSDESNDAIMPESLLSSMDIAVDSLKLDYDADEFGLNFDVSYKIRRVDRKSVV